MQWVADHGGHLHCAVDLYKTKVALSIIYGQIFKLNQSNKCHSEQGRWQLFHELLFGQIH